MELNTATKRYLTVEQIREKLAALNRVMSLDSYIDNVMQSQGLQYTPPVSDLQYPVYWTAVINQAEADWRASGIHFTK
jgi:hypothetical protein